MCYMVHPGAVSVAFEEMKPNAASEPVLELNVLFKYSIYYHLLMSIIDVYNATQEKHPFITGFEAWSSSAFALGASTIKWDMEHRRISTLGPARR